MKNHIVLVAMAVAFAVAAFMLLRNRSADESTSPPEPPAMQAGATCTLTQCRFSPVITPRLRISSAGTDLIGIWNVSVNSQHTMDMKNVSTEEVEIRGVTLSMCMNDAITPVDQIAEACRYLKLVSTSCYQGKSFVIKPGETCSTTIDVDIHGQIGRLQIDTTVGPVIVMVIAQ